MEVKKKCYPGTGIPITSPFFIARCEKCGKSDWLVIPEVDICPVCGSRRVIEGGIQDERAGES